MGILNVTDRIDPYSKKKEDILTLAQKLKVEVKKPLLHEEYREERTLNMIKYLSELQKQIVNLIKYEQRY